jgi:hypothetical protein
MQLELSTEEAHFLKAQLARHLTEVEDELVHTDVRALQADLNRDLERLRVIQARLERTLAEPSRS